MGKLKQMREQGAGEAGGEVLLIIVQCPMPKCSILRLLWTYCDLPRLTSTSKSTSRSAQAAQYKQVPNAP